MKKVLSSQIDVQAENFYFQEKFINCYLKPRSYAQYTPRCKYTPGV